MDHRTSISATRIKALRHRLGMTQQQFADALGVARNTVARWEIELSSPRGLSLAAVLKLYDMSPEPRYKIVAVEGDTQWIVHQTSSLAGARRELRAWLDRKRSRARFIDELRLYESGLDSDVLMEEWTPERSARTMAIRNGTRSRPNGST